MQPLVVLVTGASRGIGCSIATLLARQRYHVFGTSRQPDAAAHDDHFEMIALDVRSDESVQTCVSHVLDRVGRIDVVINNAGYALYGGAEETTVADAQALFETNFFGVQRMTNTVLPYMRSQGSGRIVTISSLAGLIAAPYLALYSASKFALEGYLEALRHEVKHFGIHVSLVEPGDIRGQPYIARPSRTLSDYDGIRERVDAIHMENMRTGPAPEAVARMVLHVIERRTPKLRYRVGRLQSLGLHLRHILPQGLFEGFMRRLYNLDRADS